MDAELKTLGINSPNNKAPMHVVSHSAAPLEFNVNRYTTYKTVATGTINVALLTSKANLLKMLLLKGL